MTLTQQRWSRAEPEELRKSKSLATGIHCPACKKEKARVLRIGISENPDWPVYQCRHCRLQFIEPCFDNVKEYYRTEYRKKHTDSYGHSSDNVEVQESAEQRFAIQEWASKPSAKIFKEKVPAGTSVLEIGPSAGGFLSHLVGEYDLHAVEWNEDDARFVREVGEIPCEEGEVADVFEGKTFGAIVARQVLEHTEDPWDFLATCRKRLIGGGWLFLELPNASNALCAVYGVREFQNWWYSAPHITYWEPETLANILDATGFEARVMPTQKFGLAHALYWILRGEGMKHRNPAEGLKPVHPRHPLAPALNRIWSRMDKEYRVQMETLQCTDQLRVVARRIEI